MDAIESVIYSRLSVRSLRHSNLKQEKINYFRCEAQITRAHKKFAFCVCLAIVSLLLSSFTPSASTPLDLLKYVVTCGALVLLIGLSIMICLLHQESEKIINRMMILWTCIEESDTSDQIILSLYQEMKLQEHHVKGFLFQLKNETSLVLNELKSQLKNLPLSKPQSDAKPELTSEGEIQIKQEHVSNLSEDITQERTENSVSDKSIHKTELVSMDLDLDDCSEGILNIAKYIWELD